jgi:RHS repeat-associated protein
VGTGAEPVTRKFQPFGLEITTPSGGLPIKFAAMERDFSSGNDFDHARYQSSLLGRFLGPDLLQGSAEDPQSWNRYSYVFNNPLKYIDPLGLQAEGVLVKVPDDPCKGVPPPCEHITVNAEDPIRRAQQDIIFSLLVQPYFSLLTGSENSVRQLGLDLLHIGLNSAGPLFKGLPVGLAIRHVGKVAPRLERLSAKILRDMERRGWTKEMIEEAFRAGPVEARIDKTVSPFGNATRYVHPGTGQSVVINDVTGNVIQVGAPGFRF